MDIFLLLQFELVRPTSIQSMLGGSVTMMFISFIFIPNILCSMWVAFSIASIGTGVLGYMALWGVNLDSISMIDQPHYVYRILSWLYCSHLLCLHVFWIQRTQGENERISLRTRSPHLPRRYEYNPGSECSHSHRQLYLPCVLQDDVHGNSIWCSTRDVLTSCSSVHIWTWLMFKTEEKYRWNWEDIPTSVLYSTPLPASHDSHEW